MGHFSHNCKLSSLPITSGPAVLIAMVPSGKLYDNSDESLHKYGKTYLCSNDGPRMKYYPCWLPIKGDYDTYGGLENIQEDANTRALEKYYGLSISELVGIVTCGRKDDGYSDELTVIKKPVEYPDDWVVGEQHFARYQRLTEDKMPPYPDSPSGKYRVSREGKMVEATKEEYDADMKLVHEHYKRYNTWKETNPDYDDDYGNPQYQERYKDLLKISGMWVHGELYEKLVKIPRIDYFDRLDLGTPEILTSLGFTETGKSSDERFKRVFEKDGLKINSDGTWINIPKQHIYSLTQLKKYCESNGVEIDIEEMNKKTKVAQIIDYKIGKIDSLLGDAIFNESFFDMIDEMEDGEEKTKLLALIEKADLDKKSVTLNARYREIGYYFLSGAYSSYNTVNPMMEEYFQAVKTDPSLRDNIVDFWKFDGYMYDLGRYYEIVGTGPQDGEHKSVLEVVNISKGILEEYLSDYEDDEDDE